VCGSGGDQCRARVARLRDWRPCEPGDLCVTDPQASFVFFAIFVAFVV
jgi:hypothetical protein